MAYETLETEQEGPILRVWLARPERLNAIDETVLREVGDLFLSLEQRFDVRVVVLGGRGRSFSAGADRKSPLAPKPEQGARERRFVAQLGRRACRAIEECEVLTVARVHGHALGGGFCLAASCDFRIAARDARFRLPEVELGIPLSWAGVPRLIHEIGAARARELLIRCREIDGARAEVIGLAHAAVPEAELDAEVARWVEDLLARPELSVHMTKTQLRAYARVAALGDVSESDGDLIGIAGRAPGQAERMAKGFAKD